MKKLHKHLLNPEPTLEYFKSSIDETNLISSTLLKTYNYKDGSFFTLLPADADLTKIYDFDSFILKQNPLIEYGDGAKKSKYQIIPTIREELSEFLMGKIKNSKSMSCIIDDYNSTYNDGYEDKLFSLCGTHYKEEVYYLLNNKNISKKLILECLRLSNTFWHSLCILTEANLNDLINQELSLKKIQETCLNTSMIIAGAYDGEGYIFWERNTPHAH